MLTDGRTEIWTPISHPAISRCDKNYKLLAIFCDCTGQFVSNLVRNAEDQFSRVAAQMSYIMRKLFLVYAKTKTQSSCAPMFLLHKYYNPSSSTIQNFIQASSLHVTVQSNLSWTGVRTHEDQFSYIAAQIWTGTSIRRLSISIALHLGMFTMPRIQNMPCAFL